MALNHRGSARKRVKRQRAYMPKACKPFFTAVFLVGTAGFELATPCTPCKCATRLRYAPKEREYIRTKKNLHRMRQAFLSIASRASGGVVCRVRGTQGFAQHGRHIAQFGPRCLQFGGAQPRRGVLVVRNIARITQAIARTAEREALLVEQRADTTDEQHFVVLVIAAVGAPLHWL